MAVVAIPATVCTQGNGHLHDLAHDGADWPHVRHDAGRQCIGGDAKALCHHLARPVDVDRPVEAHIDEGQSGARGRAHRRHTGQAVHGRLQRHGDALLDFFGGHAAGFGHHRDGGLVQIRKDVHWGARQRERAPDHEHGAQQQHDRAVGERGIQ